MKTGDRPISAWPLTLVFPEAQDESLAVVRPLETAYLDCDGATEINGAGRPADAPTRRVAARVRLPVAPAGAP